MYKTINQYIKKEYCNSQKYFLKNKQYLLLNRSIFAGIISAVLISSLAAHLTKNLEYYLNTSFTIAVSYITYYSVFGVLYYQDNKKEYFENGKINSKKLMSII